MARTLAIITGASSGLGADYARQLAAQKCNLILTARRQDKLEEVAREVASAHGVSVDIVVADLSMEGGIAKVAERIRAEPTLDLLINNAGYSFVGAVATSKLERHLEMNSVHITATFTLTHAALAGMIAAGGGEIINVSSISAWFPSPGGVSYAATKAYINTLSEGVDAETRDQGIRVQALCPGFTRTGFHSSEQWGGFDTSWIPEDSWMASEDVVRMSLDHLSSGTGVIFIPGEANRRASATAVQQPYWA